MRQPPADPVGKPDLEEVMATTTPGVTRQAQGNTTFIVKSDCAG